MVRGNSLIQSPLIRADGGSRRMIPLDFNPTGFGLNFRDAVEMTQNPVNFAVCLSIICSNQSIFVKYAQRRLIRTASKMCA